MWASKRGLEQRSNQQKVLGVQETNISLPQQLYAHIQLVNVSHYVNEWPT